MNHKWSFAVAFAALLSFPAEGRADTIIVNQVGISFVPADITIQVGDTVRWVWSLLDHTVSEGDDLFIDGNELFDFDFSSQNPIVEFTFTQAFVDANPMPGGVYDYFCLPHATAGMVGTIQVEAPTGTSFCAGDGGDQMGCTDCPCSNEALAGTGGGCVNSAGQSAQVFLTGNPSVANDALRVEMTGGNPGSFAVLTSGASRAPANASNPCFGLDSGLQAISLDGLRCVVQAVQRHGARAMDVNGDIGVLTSGWGGVDAPMQGLIAQGGFAAGQTRHYQVIYRDDPTQVCQRGQNSSNGTTVTFQP